MRESSECSQTARRDPQGPRMHSLHLPFLLPKTLRLRRGRRPLPPNHSPSWRKPPWRPLRRVHCFLTSPAAACLPHLPPRVSLLRNFLGNGLWDSGNVHLVTFLSCPVTHCCLGVQGGCLHVLRYCPPSTPPPSPRVKFRAFPRSLPSYSSWALFTLPGFAMHPATKNT